MILTSILRNARRTAAAALAAACLPPLPLWAAALQVQPAASIEALGTGGYLTQLIGGLTLVIALILLLAWLLRRLPGGGPDGRQAIEILSVRAVGARERLLLVQVGDEQLLVGVTPAGMRRLHRLRRPLEIAPPETPDFGRLLRRAMPGREGS